MTPQERAKRLADAHWGYIGGLLQTHNVDEAVAYQIGWHYRKAMEHGYGHGVEDERNGMFKTLRCSACDICGGKKCPKHPAYIGCTVDAPTVKDTTADSLCHTCQRNKGCNGDYPRMKDGGCEGYLPELADMGCTNTDCCDHSPSYIRNCGIHLPGAMRSCERYTTAKQDTPTAAERPAPHTDPAVNCKYCGTACNAMGTDTTMDLCGNFTPRGEQP